jgi:hypothetical protein
LDVVNCEYKKDSLNSDTHLNVHLIRVITISKYPFTLLIVLEEQNHHKR